MTATNNREKFEKSWNSVVDEFNGLWNTATVEQMKKVKALQEQLKAQIHEIAQEL